MKNPLIRRLPLALLATRPALADITIPLSNATGGITWPPNFNHLPGNVLDDPSDYNSGNPLASAPAQTDFPGTYLYLTINQDSENYWQAEIAIPASSRPEIV